MKLRWWFGELEGQNWWRDEAAEAVMKNKIEQRAQVEEKEP